MTDTHTRKALLDQWPAVEKTHKRLAALRDVRCSRKTLLQIKSGIQVATSPELQSQLSRPTDKP